VLNIAIVYGNLGEATPKEYNDTVSYLWMASLEAQLTGKLNDAKRIWIGRCDLAELCRSESGNWVCKLGAIEQIKRSQL